MKKLFENKFVYTIVALLISIGFWCYVVVGTNPECTANLTVTNVVCEGLSELITNKELFFIGTPPEKIDVKVDGPWRMVSKANDDYVATVDFSGIKGAGEYTLKVKVTGPHGVEIKKIKPETINVTMDAGKKKSVPVLLDVYGKKRENYEIKLIDEFIPASGPTAVVSKIEGFDVKINTDAIEKTGEVMYKAVPFDSEGNEIFDKELTYDNIVPVQIERVRETDIIVDESIIPAYIKDKYNVSVELDKKTVRVVGEDKVLEENEKIEASLATVMISPSSVPQKATVNLIIPEGLHLAKDENGTVDISIKYDPVE